MSKMPELRTERRLPLYLPRRLYEALRNRAQAERLSLAEAARRAIEQFVAQERDAALREGYRRIFEIVGRGRDRQGRTDVSSRIHDYFGEAVEAHLMRKRKRR